MLIACQSNAGAQKIGMFIYGPQYRGQHSQKLQIIFRCLAGVEQVIEICTALVKQHGTIVLVGYHQSNNGMRTVDMKTWNFKAINVINGHVRRSDEKAAAMKYGMQLQSEGKLKFDGMIEYYALENVTEAFEALVARKAGLYKAVLKF